jgi:SH3-like domain-containing protein
MEERHSTEASVRNLYTIVCRCEGGGTYVRQVAAESETHAVRAWLCGAPELEALAPDQQKRVSAELAEEVPGLVQNCRNAWAATAFPLWLDIIKTCL